MKKLILKKEIIHSLQRERMRRVVGGRRRGDEYPSEDCDWTDDCWYSDDCDDDDTWDWGCEDDDEEEDNSQRVITCDWDDGGLDTEECYLSEHTYTPCVI